MAARPPGGTEFHVGFVPDSDARHVAGLCVAAEQHGFDGVWIADSQLLFRDAFIVLALVADRTERIEVATGVTNPITGHLSVLTSAIGTIQEISGGRGVLGIGVGGSALATTGLSRSSVATVEETITSARDLLDRGSTTWRGEEIHMRWSSPVPPMVLAASGPRALRAGGRTADGVLFQVGATPRLVRYALETIDEGRRSAGRPPGDVRRLVRLACVVNEDRDAAREDARAYTAAAGMTAWTAAPRELFDPQAAHDLQRMVESYDFSRHTSADAAQAELVTDAILDEICIAGTPDEVVPRIIELSRLELDGFVVPVISQDPSSLMRILAEDVIPRVRRRRSPE